jgi:tRNA (cytidine/uridine-2'-O-)-methyltransferase
MPTPPLHIVLYEPEIPPNTGNVARLCAGTGIELHLVGKLGFELSDRYLKRAGLDYWPHVNWEHVAGLDVLSARYPAGRFFYFTTKATRLYTQVEYRAGDLLVFGPETRGLPAELIAANPDTAVKIPLFGPIRSLNLSTAVGIAAYEALRQVTPF